MGTKQITSQEIKEIAIRLGADGCGIADVARFDQAPDGFRPGDIYNRCRSVVVFLKKMPHDVLDTNNPVVYTHTANLLYGFLDKVGMNLCFELEQRGIHAMPVPTDVPYMSWDADKKHGMGILSMRHAAYNAGLGILGRNTLLINKDIGNLGYIGAILVDTYVEPDPVADDFACPKGCSLCLEACPVNALDGITVNQSLCREFSTLVHPRGWDLYSCSECRRVCPMKYNA